MLYCPVRCNWLEDIVAACASCVALVCPGSTGPCFSLHMVCLCRTEAPPSCLILPLNLGATPGVGPGRNRRLVTCKRVDTICWLYLLVTILAAVKQYALRRACMLCRRSQGCSWQGCQPARTTAAMGRRTTVTTLVGGEGGWPQLWLGYNTLD